VRQIIRARVTKMNAKRAKGQASCIQSRQLEKLRAAKQDTARRRYRLENVQRTMERDQGDGGEATVARQNMEERDAAK